jgi:hypothetical protein
MGRFDALTELEEKQPPAQIPAGSPVAGVKKHFPTPPPEKSMKQVPKDKAGKVAPLHTRKRAKLSMAPALLDTEMVEKYTTHVEPSLVKKIQIEAIEQDINDYDVVRIALKEYFERNK